MSWDLFIGSSNTVSINNRSVLRAVHPIEERYGTTEMRAVWREKYRFACVVAAEVAIEKLYQPDRRVIGLCSVLREY